LIRGKNPENIQHKTEQHGYRNNAQNSNDHSQNHVAHFLNDTNFEALNSATFCTPLEIAGRTITCLQSKDRRFHLLDILFPNNFMAEAKLDTGATMEAIISATYIENLELGKYCVEKVNVIEVASGQKVTCTRIVKCPITSGHDTVDLEFIVLESTNAGILLGRPAMQKLGIDQEISKIVAERNMSNNNVPKN